MAFTEREAAVRFAKAYVMLTETLMKEGVPESLAREEARQAALIDARIEESVVRYDPAKGPCPVCDRG